MNKNMFIGVVGFIVIAGGGYLLLSGGDAKKDSQSGAVGTTQTDTATTAPADTQATPVDGNTAVTTPDAATSTASLKEFTVTGKNYSFSPSIIKVKKGDKVKITFKNIGGMHDLWIDEFNTMTKRIKTGEVGTLQFTADKSGTFEYYCSVGSHRAMGMKGTLIVE